MSNISKVHFHTDTRYQDKKRTKTRSSVLSNRGANFQKTFQCPVALVPERRAQKNHYHKLQKENGHSIVFIY